MYGDMLSAEDEQEIRFVLGHYVHFLDSADAKKWAALFTENASWIRRNAAPIEHGGSGIAAGVRKGQKELTALVTEAIAVNFKCRSRHFITDLVLWKSDDPLEAKGRCRMLITDWRGGPGRIAMAGAYDFVFSKTIDGWRISTLTAEFLPD
ncbi:nuclear transport factor 2 family protein [Ochrobactrum sp. Q0168]|uniref:nuclear transport factor 2 family protein n=1 Tax=Ochrobactrum sp. Q0168 TaxID=2793241 RepID=UPI0018ED35A0|nr:nuclear transport factor 2 family protein [Ochrobactrum sp. Q0168]